MHTCTTGKAGTVVRPKRQSQMIYFKIVQGDLKTAYQHSQCLSDIKLFTLNDVYPTWQWLLGSSSCRERQTVICNLPSNFFTIKKGHVLFLGLALLRGMLFVCLSNIICKKQYLNATVEYL